PSPTPPLFPYTTLFRSRLVHVAELLAVDSAGLVSGEARALAEVDRASAERADEGVGRPRGRDVDARPGEIRRTGERAGEPCRVRSEEHTSELQSQSNLV